MRAAEIERNTKETQIRVRIDLDGQGTAKLATGIPFLEHMLDQVARHGMVDLEVQARGDLHIDGHHTVEDIGIALIDTILFTRSAEHADRIKDLMTQDPEAAARVLRVAADELPDPTDPMGLLGVMDTIQEGAVTLAVNEAWLLMGGCTLAALSAPSRRATTAPWAVIATAASPPAAAAEATRSSIAISTSCMTRRI